MDDTEDVTEADVTAAREEVIEAMARSAAVYGAKRSYGRLYGICYFASGPLSMDELVERSDYAKSTVSTAMRTLERYHLVSRRTVPGEGKRAFFEAERDFWYVFQQFLDREVRREIETMTRALEAAEMVLAEADEGLVGEDLERVRTLKSAYERGERVVDLVTSRRLERVLSALDRLHR